jgi:hypothetical protein
LGSLKTGQIARRSPKNISIVRGLYDGQGCFEAEDASIEAHLATIESAASLAIRGFTATAPGAGANPGAEIWRFLAWQAARTPGWMELVQQWTCDFDPESSIPTVEPPPQGLNETKDRFRKKYLENPATGERREIIDMADFASLRKNGWKWILSRDEQLEMLHIQAWYFQVRHFPRFSWTRLNVPEDQWFITSDRGVSWTADGCANTPPAALRHPTAQIIAPITRTVALVGTHGPQHLGVTPRDVNRVISSMASEWIAGPTRAIVEQAIRDRASPPVNCQVR